MARKATSEPGKDPKAVHGTDVSSGSTDECEGAESALHRLANVIKEQGDAKRARSQLMGETVAERLARTTAAPAWARYAETVKLADAYKVYRNGIQESMRAALKETEAAGARRFFLVRAIRNLSHLVDRTVWKGFAEGVQSFLLYRDLEALRSRVDLSRRKRPRTDVEALRGDAVRALARLVREGTAHVEIAEESEERRKEGEERRPASHDADTNRDVAS